MEIFNSKKTPQIVNRILSDKFKFADKESNGYKYMNILLGMHSDITYDNIDEVYHNNTMENFDYSAISEVSEVSFVTDKDEIITSLKGDSNNTIKIVDSNIFYNGTPTRILSETYPLKIENKSGIEYVRTDISGSGKLALNPKDPKDKVVEYNISNIGVINGTPTQIENKILHNGISEESNGNFEVLEYQDYSKIYPWKKQVIKDDTEYYDYYEPFNYIEILDENDNITGYKSIYSDSPYEMYYSEEHDNYIYHRVAYNNPNVGNIFELTEVSYNNFLKYNKFKLKYKAITNTVKVYDFINLDKNQKATEIPNVVNNDKVYFNVSEDGSEVIIYNGNSKYYVEYNYLEIDENGPIFSTSGNRYVKTDGNTISLDKAYNEKIEIKHSFKLSDNLYKIIIDADRIRPNTNIHKIEFKANISANDVINKNTTYYIGSIPIPGKDKNMSQIENTKQSIIQLDQTVINKKYGSYGTTTGFDINKYYSITDSETSYRYIEMGFLILKNTKPLVLLNMTGEDATEDTPAKPAYKIWYSGNELYIKIEARTYVCSAFLKSYQIDLKILYNSIVGDNEITIYISRNGSFYNKYIVDEVEDATTIVDAKYAYKVETDDIVFCNYLRFVDGELYE